MIVLGLQDEIRRSEESRYDHRLHGVLLVAQGMTCPEAARVLGDAARTVEYWVHTFEEMGLAGLLEGERSGRPRRLSDKQIEEVNVDGGEKRASLAGKKGPASRLRSGAERARKSEGGRCARPCASQPWP